jgi:hypothetical protein
MIRGREYLKHFIQISGRFRRVSTSGFEIDSLLAKTDLNFCVRTVNEALLATLKPSPMPSAPPALGI